MPVPENTGQSQVMKNIYLSLILLAAWIIPYHSHAQIDVVIGAGSVTGTTSNGVATDAGPMYNTGGASGFVYSKHHFVYTAAELATNGVPAGVLITKISWYKANNAAYSSASAAIFDIYLKNSSATGVPTPVPQSFSTITSGASQVYASTTQSFSSAIGWVEFTLSTPFLYTGGALEVTTNWDISAGGATAVGSTGNFAWAKDPGTNILSHADGTQSPNFTFLRTSRAQVRFTYTSATPCVAPPTAGTSNASPNAGICTGTNVALSLSGTSTGSGLSFQWESASSLAGPYTPFGTSSPSPATSVAVTSSMYYRAAVTCGASTDYSVPVFVQVNPAFPGGTYTLNASMPTDVGSGGSNFQSFTDFKNAINCGIGGAIILNVAPGVYNEQLVLDGIGGTSSTNTVTINGGGGATLSFISTNTSQRGVITLNGTDFVTINGMNIVSSSTLTTDYGWGIFMTNDADNNTITGCNITLSTSTTSTNHAGIVISGSATGATTAGSNCDNNVISNNTIDGGYYGITLVGGTGASMINNNQITGNIIKNFYLYGVYSGGTDNTLVELNDLHRINRSTLTTFAPLYFLTYHGNLKIRRNKIHDAATASPTTSFTAYGVYLSASNPPVGSENEISNNVIYKLSGEGSHYGFYNSSSGNTRYYYNSVSMDAAGATGTGTTYGFYQTTIQSGIELRNNNISISRTTSGNKVGIYMSSGITGFSSNNNNVFVNGASSNYFGYSTSLQASIANWQAATSQDAASYSMNPMFVNVSGGDLTPGNALLDNKGTPVSVLIDYNANMRDPSTPDVGAIEFTVPLCNGLPNPGTATASIAAGCIGAPVVLNLNGFTNGLGIEVQWESAPAGTGSFSSISGATSSTYTDMLTGATDYRAVVTCTNGGSLDYSNTVTVSQNPVYLCYCSPLTGVTLHSTTGNYITNVAIPGTGLNVSTSAVGAGAYTQHYPLTATNTATLTQGQTYTLNANIASASYATKMWIDWDQSGTFDATEYYSLSNATTGTVSILVPFTAVPGMTGLRLRNTASTTTVYGAGDACANITIGRETEDFVITVAASPQCSGTPVNAGTATSNVPEDYNRFHPS
ncbi:MAG: hypothetical protein EOP49_09120, partial [Sphingobacteriales bacterium]